MRRFKNFLYGIFLFCLVGFILWWMFIGEKGTLIITGDVPDIIQGSNDSLFCHTTPCQLSIRPGTYSFLFHKSGYISIEKNISVPLWSTNTIHLIWEEEPHLLSLGSIRQFSPSPETISSTYTDNQQYLPITQLLAPFSDIPTSKNTRIQVISFSPTREYTFIQTSSQKSFLQNKAGELFSLSLPAISKTPIWISDDIFVFWEQQNTLWKLYAYHISRQTNQFVGNFYNLEHGTLIPMKNGVSVIEPYGMYLVDITNGKKQFVLDNLQIISGKWNTENSMFVFQTKQLSSHIWYVDQKEPQILGDTIPLSNITINEQNQIILANVKDTFVHIQLFSSPFQQIASYEIPFKNTAKEAQLEKIEYHNNSLYLLIGDTAYTIKGTL